MPLPAPIAVQMFSLREAADADLPGLLRRVGAMGYVGVEFAGLHGHSASSIRSVLDDAGLVAGTAHVQLLNGEDPLPVIDEVATLGGTTMICNAHADSFRSRDSIGRLADQLTALAGVAAGHGMEVGYHNHWWEFDHLIEGLTPHAMLLELTDPRVVAEVDIYWARVGGADPVSVLVALGERLRAIHVKDGPARRGEPMTAVGDGVLDIPTILRAGEAADWHIVELDDCATDMEAAIARSCEYLDGTGLTLTRAPH